ncbi:MAG: glycosyl hydrolase family 88 [Firmicutes bacterium]|nr:glycosyl hydrolase family 88 [Bacillota bacterium]
MQYKLDEENIDWINDIWIKITNKLSKECERIGDKIPYIPENGKYSDKGETDICWWTNGFWPGMLWQMYHATKEEQYKSVAEKVEARLDAALEKYIGLHHDVGFMWLHSAVANYRLTGNERALARGLHAAHLLAGRYNPRGNFIRAWNRDRAGWIIVDSMLNIPLLYWAAAQLGDPRFQFMAENHADTVMKQIVREDGSCNHIVILDPYTGDFVDNPGGQGYESGSSWSRGQAWAIYGFALSYHYTKRPEFLATAKRVAHYLIANISTTGYVPLVDFRAPQEPVKWDTTAGVCAACGLLEIAKVVPDLEKGMYTNAALNIIKAIEIKYCNWDENEDSIVSHGTGAYSSVEDLHVPIIYGDYFFIEAVLRLLDKDFLIW